jgi:hypothetical protein
MATNIFTVLIALRLATADQMLGIEGIEPVLPMPSAVVASLYNTSSLGPLFAVSLL